MIGWKIHSKLSATFLVCMIFFVAVFVRFFNSMKSSIWHDEGFSVMMVDHNIFEIWQLTARDVHPPFYYILLNIWINIFGKSVLAVRMLSIIFGLGIVLVGYLLVRRIAGRRAAILATLFLALAPFLIRYSQEARMYGMLGFWMIAAVYALTRMLENPKHNLWFVIYGLVVLAGLYTHYFTILAIASFWLFLIIDNRWFFKEKRWWLTHLIISIGYLPWFSNMLAQIIRGQGLGWLQRADVYTFFNTLWQFMTFTDGRKLPLLIYLLIGFIFIGLIIYLWCKDHTRFQFLHLIIIFSLTPILIAIFISLFRPIFHERYFAFAATGFYMILAIGIDQLFSKQKWLLCLSITALVVIVELIGIRNVYSQSDHQMNSVMAVLNSQYELGDAIVAGELYVYFDGSYYNKTSQLIRLYTPNNRDGSTNHPLGFGESSLLYQRADQIYLDSYNDINTKRVWLIGKTGDQSYYIQIPATWQLIKRYIGGYSEIRLYEVK